MNIRPFAAIRPASEYVEKVAAPPYDVLSSEEARNMVEGNPYSFLHVDKSEIDLPLECNVYSREVYEKAADNLQRLIDNKILKSDDSASLYIYRLSMGGRVQTGLVCCTSVDEYISGSIKKHELTRADKEEDRTNHVDITDANTGPIFMTYRDQNGINSFIESFISSEKNKPCYDFKSEDGVSHTVWVISESGDIERLILLFKEVTNLYIADGHHRNASAVNVAKLRRTQASMYTGDEEFNYYLSVLFPYDQLRIMDYNRAVRDLNGMTPGEFVDALDHSFIVKRVTTPYGVGYRPSMRHTFGMYLDDCWYALQLRDNIVDESDSVASLDVSVLQKYVLDALLDIVDPRTDKRIDFIGGVRGLRWLESLVDSQDFAVAFSMYPTSMQELMAIADADKLMPPKSTWFEPKLKSGLFVHKLS